MVKFREGENYLAQVHEDSSGTVNLIDAVAKTLRVTSTEEIEGLTDVLMPSILCAAVLSISESLFVKL